MTNALHKYLLILFAFSYCGTMQSQGTLDSLNSVWKNENNSDSIRLDALGKISGQMMYIDVDSALILSRLHLEKSKKLGDTKSQALAERNIGNSYYFKGDYPDALEHYQKALTFYKSIDFKHGTAVAYNSIAMINNLLGSNEEAVKSSLKALDIALKENDTLTQSRTYNNLGIFYELIDLDSALMYYKKSRKLKEKLGDKKGLGNTLANMGSIYEKKGNIEKSIEYREKAKEIFESLASMRRIAGINAFLGESYVLAGRIDDAIKVCSEGVDFARHMKSPSFESQNCNCLYKAYKEKKDHVKALHFLELANKLKDSVRSKEAEEELLHQKYKFQYETKAAIDSVKAADKARQHRLELQAEKAINTKLKWQQNMLYIGIGVALLILGLIVLILVMNIKRLREIRAQKAIIEEQKSRVESQKELIEEKNKEITSSIQYAQRIQEAILPADEQIRELLRSNFVLYLPKDIVAGDFYWIDRVGDKTVFAAADCTGHGVPGAMVSVVCHNALNRCTREFGLTDPSDILDKCRDLVVDSFESGVHDVKDGMDISICSYHEETLELKYAGANNDLYYLRDGVMNELSADRQPIGKYRDSKPFKTHTLQLKSGDHIYLFTDGFADQFGGEKGKKFKYKHFKELLTKTADLNVLDQKKHIEEVFRKWKGDLEQLDDVCVIGVRI